MEKFEIPMELEEELEILRKRDRIYTWILIALLVVIAGISVKMYLQSKEENVNAGQYVQNGVPLANASSLPAGANQSTAGGISQGCGSGGCGGGPKVPAEELEKQALEDYKDQFGDKAGIKATVVDFGCHQQIDIMDKDSNLLKSYQFRGGQLSLMGQ